MRNRIRWVALLSILAAAFALCEGSANAQTFYPRGNETTYFAMDDPDQIADPVGTRLVLCNQVFTWGEITTNNKRERFDCLPIHQDVPVWRYSDTSKTSFLTVGHWDCADLPDGTKDCVFVWYL